MTKPYEPEPSDGPDPSGKAEPSDQSPDAADWLGRPKRVGRPLGAHHA